MSLRLTSILAALVAVAAWLVLREPLADGPPGAAIQLESVPAPYTPTPGIRLLDFSLDEVEAVEFQQADLHFTLSRGDSNGRDDSSKDLLTNLFADIGTLRAIDTIDASDANLADFGLEPAELQLKVARRGRPRQTSITIGHHNPTNNAVYVRLDDQGPIYLAGSLLRWKIEAAIRQWRQRHPDGSPTS